VVTSARNTVLVIEDDPFIGAYIAEIVESFFAVPVLIANTAAAARQLYHANEPALAAIISDLTLPGANGIALVTELAAQNHAISITFVTGHSPDPKELSKAVGRPVSLVLKPFNPADIETILKRVLKTSPPREVPTPEPMAVS
jgi:CheY-like chemotaxis protein